MKYLKFILTTLIMVTIISCKTKDADKDPLLSNSWETEIALDGTDMWIANNETTLGVNKMFNILENLDTSSEIDYTALGTDLKKRN